MKKGFFLAVLLLVTAVCLGCSTNRFTIYKDGRDYYFGSNRKGLHKILCESGDLKNVLAGSSIPANVKNDLFRYGCVEPSVEKEQGLYALLSPDEKQSLWSAFEAQGYDINRSPCA